jgi:hypothetical protein
VEKQTLQTNLCKPCDVTTEMSISIENEYAEATNVFRRFKPKQTIKELSYTK